jgi:hydroxyquinol 1,2-dioxygenase
VAGPPVDARRDLGADTLTDAVLASFEGATDERYRELMQALVRHLHSYITEVSLTEEEWGAAIDFLTRTGHITDERRQEFILLSDVLGASMQVIAVNHPGGAQATESTVFGPFFVEGSPGFENGADISAGAKGRPCHISGRVLGPDGEPVPGALIEVWQADEDGFYDVQYEGARVANRGHLHSDAEGRFSFWAVEPTAYPIPADGPVGELLAAAGRGPMRPAHVHFMVSAEGHETLITHVFAAGDTYLDEDAVFGVKEALIAPFEQHPGGETAPDGSTPTEPYSTMSYDLRLAGRPGAGKEG